MRKLITFVLAISPLLAHGRETQAKIELVRPWDLRKLTSIQKIQYYRALQTLVTTMELGTDGKEQNRNAMTSLIFPPAQAMAKTGDECVIGGYMSTWLRRSDGNLACQAPNDTQMFDVTSTPKKFLCGGAGDSGDSRSGYCNSAVYLYANDGGERFCQPLRNFATNCKNAFENRYGKALGKNGDPNYPARLNRDFETYARNIAPQDLDARMDDYEQSLNAVVEGNDFDARSSENIRRQIGILKDTKSRVSLERDKSLENTQDVSPPAAASQAASGLPSTPEQTGLPASTFSNTAGSSLSVNSAANLNASSLKVSHQDTADETSGDNAANGTSAASLSDPILGRELSCIRDALIKAGYDPSAKFLALIGTGVQASNGAYDLNEEASRKLFQSKAISMVQSYGFCDEKSYPSRKMSHNHVALVRRFITADNGKATAKPGLSYIRQMLDPQSNALASRDVVDIFGLQSKVKAGDKSPDALDKSVDAAFGSLFSPLTDDWEKKSLADRQLNVHGWQSASPKSEFANCHANAQKRRTHDRAFRLQELRIPAADKDGRRPPIAEDKKKLMQAIYDDNAKLCSAMAKSCGVEADKACGSPDIPGVIRSTPGQTAPPAAPAGNPGQRVK